MSFNAQNSAAVLAYVTSTFSCPASQVPDDVQALYRRYNGDQVELQLGLSKPVTVNTGDLFSSYAPDEMVQRTKELGLFGTAPDDLLVDFQLYFVCPLSALQEALEEDAGEYLLDGRWELRCGPRDENEIFVCLFQHSEV